MKDLSIILSLGLLALATIFVIAFASTGFNLAQLKFWGPQYAEAERAIFEESTSYNHAMVRNLNKIRQDYRLAEEGSTERQILRGTFLHEVNAYDRERLPSHLIEFLEEMENHK